MLISEDKTKICYMNFEKDCERLLQEIGSRLERNGHKPPIDLNKRGREHGKVKGKPEERAAQLALYMLENKQTVRGAAKAFGISKSTVHKDVTERLRKLNKPLYLQVKILLEQNKAERHIRGGQATKEKYRAGMASPAKAYKF